MNDPQRHETAAHDGLRADFTVSRPDGFALELSLQIEPGTTAALLGPNGSGKSTTVECLAGLIPIDDGVIDLAGRTLDQPATDRFVPAEDRAIGIVFQDYLLFPGQSVLDNVAFGPRSQGAPRRKARQIAQRWIEALQLGGLEQRKPHELSGGQAQRVALARALATDPGLLLLDEPLAALDIATRTRMRRALVDHLQTFDGPRLLITHEPNDAFVLADCIHILEDGRLTQSGTAEQIRRRPATPYVAALTGTNLLTGTNRDGTITLHDDSFQVRCASRENGPVQAVIAPRAVSLHRQRPQGSPRNTWSTTIDWIEPLGETTRIRLAGPLPLMVDITPAAADALRLAPGGEIWAAVKATEVTVTAMAENGNSTAATQSAE